MIVEGDDVPGDLSAATVVRGATQPSLVLPLGLVYYGYFQLLFRN
jgi:hypothetical protein